MDVEKVTKWIAPECNGAPLLCMPNIVKPCHSLCIPGDAKILTPNGWKEISKAEVGDIAMCWANGHLFFDMIQATTKSFCPEVYMIGYNKRHNFDILYSPQHRLPIEAVSYSWGKNGRYKYDQPHIQTKVYTAEDFTPKTSRRFITSGRGTGQQHILTDEERVYIAIQADGILHRIIHSTGLNEYRIKVVKERKAKRLREILLQSGFQWSEHNTTTGVYTFAVWVPVEAKTFSNVFSYNMGYDKARAFIEELCFWDGHTSVRNIFGKKVKVRYYCSSRYDNIEFVQAIAAQSGFTTNTIKRPAVGNSHGHWQVWFEDKTYRSCGDMKKELLPYNNYMYCITVPSSFFLMKWQDKIVITGNCPRNIMGQTKWNLARAKCYMDADYTCEICGQNLGAGKCASHELYSTDYLAHRVVFERYICVCKKCHDLIHSGRSLTMYKRDGRNYSKDYLLSIAKRGMKLVYDYNQMHEHKLQMYGTLIEWMKDPELGKWVEPMVNQYQIEFYSPVDPGEDKKSWGKWRLIYNGKEYEPKYKNAKEWEEAMGEKQ